AIILGGVGRIGARVLECFVGSQSNRFHPLNKNLRGTEILTRGLHRRKSVGKASKQGRQHDPCNQDSHEGFRQGKARGRSPPDSCGCPKTERRALYRNETVRGTRSGWTRRVCLQLNRVYSLL